MENFLTKLGASSVFITGAEVYTALQLGTVDYAGWTSQAWEVMNFKDVSKYYLSNLALPVGHLTVNVDSWKALDDDLKRAVRLSAAHYSRVVATEYAAAERLLEARMKEGTMIILPEAEIAKMRKAAVQVWDEIAAKTPRCAEAVGIVKDYLRKNAVIK